MIVQYNFSLVVITVKNYYVIIFYFITLFSLMYSAITYFEKIIKYCCYYYVVCTNPRRVLGVRTDRCKASGPPRSSLQLIYYEGNNSA